MTVSFAFNVDLRIRRANGAEISLIKYKLSPIDKAFIYTLIDFPMDFFLKNVQEDFNWEYQAEKILKNKF